MVENDRPHFFITVGLMDHASIRKTASLNATGMGENRDFLSILLEWPTHEGSLSQGLSPRTGGLHTGVVHASGGPVHGGISLLAGQALHARALQNARAGRAGYPPTDRPFPCGCRYYLCRHPLTAGGDGIEFGIRRGRGADHPQSSP